MVTDIGTYRKPVGLCDFLTDISRTVSKLSQIIVKILDTLLFEPPFGGLRATYTVHRSVAKMHSPIAIALNYFLRSEI